MAKTDWSITDVVRPQDMNSIGAEINQLRDDVDHIEVPLASTTQAGIVQLSNATNGAREDVAATEWAVAQAFQAGSERKAQAVAVLIAKGVSATVAESWDSIIAKLTALVVATGNAELKHVLASKTFSNASGNNLVGTMPNRGSYVNATSAGQWGDGALAVYLPEGYYGGGINGGSEAKVTLAQLRAAEPDLNPAYFRSDVNIFGLQGTMPIRRPDVLSHINAGISFGIHSGDGIPYIYLSVPNNHLLQGVDWARYHDPNLHAGNVRNGTSLFGGALVGTMVPKQVHSVHLDRITSAANVELRGVPFQPTTILISSIRGAVGYTLDAATTQINGTLMSNRIPWGSSGCYVPTIYHDGCVLAGTATNGYETAYTDIWVVFLG